MLRLVFQCNNPMTKEAKLSAAMRIVPEWKEYDEEVRGLQQKIDSGLLDDDPAENMTAGNFSTLYSSSEV